MGLDISIDKVYCPDSISLKEMCIRDRPWSTDLAYCTIRSFSTVLASGFATKLLKASLLRKMDLSKQASTKASMFPLNSLSITLKILMRCPAGIN